MIFSAYRTSAILYRIILVAAFLVLTTLVGCATDPHSAGDESQTTPVLSAAEAAALATDSTVALINHTAPASDYFGAQWCGATLTTPTSVVSAAHCVRGRLPRSIDVVIGADNLCNNAPRQGERVQVSAIHILPDRTLDLAILTTQRPTRIHAAKTATVDSESADSEMVAVGWGRSHANGPSSCRKQAVPLHIGAADKCETAEKANPNRWNPSQLCATAAPGAERNTCVGDSGGPVYQVSPGQTHRIRFVAVTTWGVGCAPDQVGFYSPATRAAVAASTP